MSAPYTVQRAPIGGVAFFIRGPVPTYGQNTKIAEVVDIGAGSEALAKLFAASPVLLATLERIAAGDPNNTQFAALAIAEARDAIAAAKGEA